MESTSNKMVHFSKGIQKIRFRKGNKYLARRVIVLGFMIAFLFTIFSFAIDIPEKININSDKQVQTILKDYEPIEVFIESGATAWEIQSALIPDEDVREVLFNAQMFNSGKSMGELETGTVVTFLKKRIK